MGSSSVEAGKAFVKLMVEDKDFAKSLDGSLRKLNNFANGAARLGAVFGGLGSLITAPLVAATKIFASAGSDLADMAGRTGLSAKAMSELKFAAEQTGTSLEAVEKAAREMQSKGLDPNRIFDMAASIAAIEDPTQRAQAAFELWGKKAGAALLPMLSDLPRLREEANKLGLVWSDEMVNNADNLGDVLDKLKSQFGALAAVVGNAVAPAVSSVLGSLTVGVKAVIDFAKENQQLFRILGVVAGSATAFGVAVLPLSLGIRGVTTAVKDLTAALTLLGRHPYMALATIAAGALLTQLMPLIEKWLGLADATDTVTTAITKHTGAEQQLLDALDESTGLIDAKTEALKRLHAEENKAASENAIKAQMEDIKARESILGQRTLPGLGGLSVEIQGRQKALDDLRGELANIESSMAGKLLRDSQDDLRITELRSEIKTLEAEMNSLQAQKLFANPLGIASMFGFGRPFGMMGGVISRDLFHGYNSGERFGRGLRGFSSPPQLLGTLIPGVTGPRGTFNGQLATQIFGGSGTLSQNISKMRDLSQRTLRVMERIEQKLPGGVGPAFKVGMA